MKRLPHHFNGVFLSAGTALAIFIIDIQTALGVAIGVLYILAIPPVFTSGKKEYMFAAAVICSTLVIAAYYMSPTGEIDIRYARVNRFIELIVIWITAILCRMLLILDEGHREKIRDAEKLTAELEKIRIKDKREQRAMSSIMEDLRLERAKLLISDQRFRDTLNSAPVAMVMVNADGEVIEINRKALQLFDYDKDEIMGRHAEILFSEEYRSKAFPLIGGNTEFRNRDLSGMRKDGTRFPVEMGRSNIETEGGNLTLGAFVDVTERRKFEKAQLRANEELESRVRVRTTELGELNEALERSNIELKQFAYVASHDLQTPLRSISNFSQFLYDEYHEKLDDSARHYLDRIKSGVERMETLINDLLVYSRVESKVKDFEEINLDDICDEVIDLMKFDVAKVGGKVSRSDLPTIKGDATQMLQLFQNLTGNALKYRSESPLEIRISSHRKDTFWIISISDNGIGIDGEHHERIFEIFKRLHNQKEYPGTGIGLAVCRRIVTRHNGTIWLESEPGKGSTFHFSIPVATEERQT
ncbi:MAG: ATP-binding protein [Verrucomicrobiales bacterium]|nr:ATP-binding protein [Verrucomicrobiales bacterium]